MKRIKKKIKAIIFDMDGTIIKTEHIWQKATFKILAKRGYTDFNKEQHKVLHSLSGIGITQAWKLLKKAFNFVEHIDCLVQEHVKHVEKGFKNGVRFVDGFKNFHKELIKHAMPSAIATNTDSKSLKTLSNIMMLDQFFGNNLYCIDHVNNTAKPDPALFLHTAEKLGVTPEECIVFEDSIYGFQAAKAAGMRCIAIKHDGNTSHRHHAHEEIDDYTQALSALYRVVDRY